MFNFINRKQTSRIVLALVASGVASASVAADAVSPLPFEDGSLLALGTSCVVGLVWLLRNKNS